VQKNDSKRRATDDDTATPVDTRARVVDKEQPDAHARDKGSPARDKDKADSTASASPDKPVRTPSVIVGTCLLLYARTLTARARTRTVGAHRQ
jgi:hypothetical protein